MSKENLIINLIGDLAKINSIIDNIEPSITKEYLELLKEEIEYLNTSLKTIEKGYS